MDTVYLFKGIQIFSIVLLFFLFLYTRIQKTSVMQKHASLLSLSTIFMLFGYLMEMQATTLEGAYYGNIVSYI